MGDSRHMVDWQSCYHSFPPLQLYADITLTEVDLFVYFFLLFFFFLDPDKPEGVAVSMGETGREAVVLFRAPTRRTGIISQFDIRRQGSKEVNIHGIKVRVCVCVLVFDLHTGVYDHKQYVFLCANLQGSIVRACVSVLKSVCLPVKMAVDQKEEMTTHIFALCCDTMQGTKCKFGVLCVCVCVLCALVLVCRSENSVFFSQHTFSALDHCTG